jgi:hypothetical protein
MNDQHWLYQMESRRRDLSREIQNNRYAQQQMNERLAHWWQGFTRRLQKSTQPTANSRRIRSIRPLSAAQLPDTPCAAVPDSLRGSR